MMLQMYLEVLEKKFLKIIEIRQTLLLLIILKLLSKKLKEEIILEIELFQKK